MASLGPNNFNEYGDSLKFFWTREVVVNSDQLNSTTIVKEKNMVLLKAAEYLRNEHTASCDTSNWPPTVEKLREFDEKLPDKSIIVFNKNLKPKDNPLSGSIQRYVHFFGSDLVNAMANGKNSYFQTFPFRTRSAQDC